MKTVKLISNALEHRRHLLSINPEHNQALRLFNGYLEGYPGLVIEIFSHTLAFFFNLKTDLDVQKNLYPVQDFILEQLPWINTVLIKMRKSSNPELKRGILVYGNQPAKIIREHNLKYALDLQLNQDASFYVDTRLLRAWLIENTKQKTVLNTFAYTGSFGAAALAGDAAKVIQTDINNRFLDIARNTYKLNGFSIKHNSLISADYFKLISQFKKQGRLFDIVILDPPFFSTTRAGRVDMIDETRRLINKVRPLVAHNGKLIVINNALYVSGSDFMQTLQQICQSGYAQIEDRIPVPEDVLGNPHPNSTLPADPAPFNHPTKIAVMNITRKDRAGAV